MGNSDSKESASNASDADVHLKKSKHEFDEESKELTIPGSAKRKEDSKLKDSMEPLDASKLAPSRALLYAAQKGDQALIRKCLKDGAKLNASDITLKAEEEEEEDDDENKNKKRKKKKDENEEKEVIDKDHIYPTGDTALHLACQYGHSECVQLLYLLGADVESKNKIGSTPLHRAISSNQLACVEILIVKCGAKVDAVNYMGNNALHIAAYAGLNEIAEFLLTKANASRLLELRNRVNMLPEDYAKKSTTQQLLGTYRPKVDRNFIPQLDFRGPSSDPIRPRLANINPSTNTNTHTIMEDEEADRHISNSVSTVRVHHNANIASADRDEFKENGNTFDKSVSKKYQGSDSRSKKKSAGSNKRTTQETVQEEV